MPAEDDVTGVLDCWYHQFWVGAEDYDFETDPLEAGMFCPRADGSGMMIHAATHSGYVRVTLRSRPSEPALPADEWDDVARGSLETDTPSLFAVPPLGDGDGLELALPRAGTFAFQISAMARGEVRDDDEADPTDPDEHYLIEVWPIDEPLAPTCIRVTSTFGRQRLAEAAAAAANPPPAEEIEESAPPRHRSLHLNVWRTTEAALDHAEGRALADGDHAAATEAARIRDEGRAFARERPPGDEYFFLPLSAEADLFVTAAVEGFRAITVRAGTSTAGEETIEHLDRTVSFWQSPVDFQVSREPPEEWTPPGPITVWG